MQRAFGRCAATSRPIHAEFILVATLGGGGGWWADGGWCCLQRLQRTGRALGVAGGQPNAKSGVSNKEAPV
jgi:hypothetical protein